MTKITYCDENGDVKNIHAESGDYAIFKQGAMFGAPQTMILSGDVEFRQRADCIEIYINDSWVESLRVGGFTIIKI